MARASTFILGRCLIMAKRSKRDKRRSKTVAPAPSRPVASKLQPGRSAAPAPSVSPSLISRLTKKAVRPTRPNTYHSRISSEAARLSQHLERTAAVPSIAEKRKPQSKLSLIASEPDARKSSPKAREHSHCKKRPDSKKAARTGKGGGGNKRFVPWCG